MKQSVPVMTAAVLVLLGVSASAWAAAPEVTSVPVSPRQDGSRLVGIDSDRSDADWAACIVTLRAGDNDCNSNGVADTDDLANCDDSPWCSDCNGNGMLDECDVADGVSEDGNSNGVPDECEPPGDLDDDGDVDADDFIVFSDCLTGPEVPLLAGCYFADLDRDGDVDLADFAAFAHALAPAPTVPPGMVLIPGGEFQMGDTFTEGYTNERPVHPVCVSAFYMDRYEVTKALWDAVRAWGLANGYTDLYASGGKGADHPVQYVNWYDCVKWCNARSEQEGRTPCYYTDAGLTTVYRTGELAPHVKWDANGYRLPTEAEWEKAARGGTAGRRFPWSDTDTIQHARANYYSSTGYSYDTSPTRGYHPTFAVGGYPYTSPVGYFAPNGYGLYDMAGNVWEWCHDWYGSTYYSSSPYSNPTGPATGACRVLRGACWDYSAYICRVAVRYFVTPDDRILGFRCAAGAP